MTNFTLALVAVLILGSAAVAVTLRNLIHSALLLVVSWAGVAAFYLWAGAEFVAFAQLLVYVGGISMIVLFAVLLTRQSQVEIALPPPATGRVLWAIASGLAVFGVLAATVCVTDFPPPSGSAPGAVTVKELGTQLMSTHAAAVLVIGVMLTVSLLGAVVLASSDPKKKGEAP
jgi:NADH:ubiquinone oxidoreductase subunit 6 (subunit J)